MQNISTHGVPKPVLYVYSSFLGMYRSTFGMGICLNPSSVCLHLVKHILQAVIVLKNQPKKGYNNINKKVIEKSPIPYNTKV